MNESIAELWSRIELRSFEFLELRPSKMPKPTPATRTAVDDFQLRFSVKLVSRSAS